MRTNWKQVDRELQLWRISDETIEAFDAGEMSTGDLRNKMREAGMTEEVMDYWINKMENEK